MKKLFLLAVCCSFAFLHPVVGQPADVSKAPKQEKEADLLSPQQVNARFNQMMLVVMERLRAGNLPEAREVATKLIFEHETFRDSPQEVFRTFSTIMEERLYETQLAVEGVKAKVRAVPQPIADGFYLLAMIDFQQGEVEKALANLQKAIEWNPVHAAYFIERGFMILHQSNPPDFASAQAAYLRALELADTYEDFAAAMRGIGYVLVDKGDFEGALACYLRARMYDPQDPVAPKEIEFIRKQSPFSLPDIDGVKAVPLLLNRRIPAGVNPIHVKVLLGLADQLTAPDRKKELKALLKRALRLDPQNEIVKKRLAGLP